MVFRFFQQSKQWKHPAQLKVKETLAKIPDDWILPKTVIEEAETLPNITGDFIQRQLPPEEGAITELESTDLAVKIASRDLTAEAVTRAFCRRAAYAHQLNNSLHEIFFDQALDRARELDSHLETTGSVIGPLHGIPISLKDQFHVRDVETTMGYVGWIGTFEGRLGTGKEKKVNSEIVNDLLSLGAILYCKTSLPQTLLIGETHNNIIGYTMNPVNRKLSCGGSSGGEGALQALRGSVLGLGTDIGGSVRIPSSFCGTMAIKPSVARFSYKDVANSMPGQLGVPSAIGFMSTSLKSLRLIMKSIISAEPWLRDPELCPLPWRREQELDVSDPPKLCFGLVSCDGMVAPHPPLCRAISILKAALEIAGHKVIPWSPPDHKTGTEIHRGFIGSDGGADIFNQLELSGEPLISEKSDYMGNNRSPPMSLLKYHDLGVQRKVYRAEYAAYWNLTKSDTGTGRPVDAVIMPVAPHAAVIPGKYFHYGYTEIVNLLDYTSVTLPVTKACKGIDPSNQSYQPLNERDRLNWEAYDPDLYDGAPVGLQIMGRRFEEERVLSIAEIAQAALETMSRKQR